jgi:tetratricopeptide (TPR) repeat protein
VTFSLRDGDKVSGVLVEIGRDHITLEHNGRITTTLMEMVVAWEMLGDKISESEVAAGAETGAEIIPGAQLPENNHLSAVETQPETLPAQTKTITPFSEKNPEPIFKKLVEIKTRFQARLQTANIELKTPDFIFPDGEVLDWHKTQIITTWNRISDRHEYARKINELSAKFGRIQPIAQELESLVKRFPKSSTFKKHLAYLHSLLKKEQASIESYKDAAILSQDQSDWYNVAALALSTGKEGLACYALEQFFYQVPVTEDLGAWYTYVRVLMNVGNYPALARLCETTDRNLSEAEQVFLLETGIYLLKAIGKDEVATKLVSRWITGQALQSLALEALNQLEGQPDESYQQVAAEFLKKGEEAEKPGAKAPQQPQGYIYTYKSNDNFGFLEDLAGKQYFFHRSAIIDATLYDKLNKLNHLHLKRGERLPVVFETAMGPKGPLALKVALSRTIDELFHVSIDCARDGEYAQAISHIRQVLDRDPKYPEAQDLYEKWREHARVAGVPKGSNPYTRAKGVPPEQAQAQKFNPSDVRKLENLASQLGTRRPRDRAGYYLSAAKITSVLEGESSNQFYRYLCRSLASSGDATIAEGKHLDAARELYCEALSVYDYAGSKQGKRYKQDAVNALVRFLFSTLGAADHVPLTPDTPLIDETIEQVLQRHPQQDQVFDAIAHLVLRRLKAVPPSCL